MQCRINLSRAWGKTILRAWGKTILKAGHKIYEFARGCEKVRFLRLDISEIYKGPVTPLRMRETYEKRMKINAIIFIRTKIL